MSYLLSATVLAALAAAFWRRKQCGALARGILLMGLAATGVRLLAGNVGVWAEGMLDVGITVLVTMVLPIWICVFFPTWFAWRMLHPFGLRPAVLAGFWLSALVRRRDIPSVRIFLGAVRDVPFPPASQVTADAWTALAAAVQADHQRAFARVDAIIEALTHLPSETRFPMLARQVGVEVLARRALSRRDWAAVLRITRIGHGRSVRFLDLLAQAESRMPFSPGRLWLAWMLAPLRIQTYGRVRVLARLPRRRAEIAPPLPELKAPQTALESAILPDARLRHVRLLGAAAKGQTIAMQEVLALAHAWQKALDGEALARLHARALELDVRNGAQQARTVKASVLQELTDLACVAVGGLPSLFAASNASDALLAELSHSVQRHLHLKVDKTLASLDADKTKRGTHPLAAWENWLALRESVDRFEQQVGQDALKALWYSRIRDRVWSWAYGEWTERGDQSGWAMSIVFDWMADQAEVLGDLPAAAVNRENARVARLAA